MTNSQLENNGIEVKGNLNHLIKSKSNVLNTNT